jgi:hypothetical protein
MQMDRSYLILIFAASFFLVLLIWGIYGRMTYKAPPPAATTQGTTQPLVDRLREERERRMRERGELPDVTPTTRPATVPAGQ